LRTVTAAEAHLQLQRPQRRIGRGSIENSIGVPSGSVAMQACWLRLQLDSGSTTSVFGLSSGASL
jgi:hypothetical protein